MKTIYIIKDIKNNEYYCNLRFEEGFTSDLLEAYQFNCEEEAQEELEKNYFLDNRLIEIIKVYNLTT